jgi:hypothetical protein
LYGEADSIEMGGPFLAYRNVLKGLLKFNPKDLPQQRRAKVYKIFFCGTVLMLAQIENLLPTKFLSLLSLLNMILPFNFPESEDSRWLNGLAKTELLVCIS